MTCRSVPGGCSRRARYGCCVIAQLLVAGLLVGIWVPPPEVCDLRLLVAQRLKMVRLATVAKTRLRNMLHRHHRVEPPGSQPFYPKHQDFWLGLGQTEAELAAILCDWETLLFANQQKKILEDWPAKLAAGDPRVSLLVQLPGIGMMGAITILAAIGPIEGFPTAKQLVGFAGLGARVHDSGERRWYSFLGAALPNAPPVINSRSSNLLRANFYGKNKG